MEKQYNIRIKLDVTDEAEAVTTIEKLKGGYTEFSSGDTYLWIVDTIAACVELDEDEKVRILRQAACDWIWYPLDRLKVGGVWSTSTELEDYGRIVKFKAWVTPFYESVEEK